MIVCILKYLVVMLTHRILGLASGTCRRLALSLSFLVALDHFCYKHFDI